MLRIKLHTVIFGRVGGPIKRVDVNSAVPVY